MVYGQPLVLIVVSMKLAYMLRRWEIHPLKFYSFSNYILSASSDEFEPSNGNKHSLKNRQIL